MKRSIEDTSVVFIGAGNLATNLAKALYYKGFRIVQVYSRTEESARTLAQAVEAAYTTDLSSVAADARLYIVSLKDAAFVQLLPEIVAGKENALWQGKPVWRVLSDADIQQTAYSRFPTDTGFRGKQFCGGYPDTERYCFRTLRECL